MDITSMSRTSTSSSWLGLERRGQHLGRVDPQAGEELRVGPGHPGRGALQAVAVGVLADRDQDLADGALDPGEVDGVVDGSSAEPAVDQPGREVIKSLAVPVIRFMQAPVPRRASARLA